MQVWPLTTFPSPHTPALHGVGVGVAVHSDGGLGVNLQLASLHAYDMRRSAEGGAQVLDCFRTILRLSDHPQSGLKTSAGGCALAAQMQGLHAATADALGAGTSEPVEAEPFDRGAAPLAVRPAVRIGVYMGVSADGAAPLRHAAHRTALLKPLVAIHPAAVSRLGGSGDSSPPSSHDVAALQPAPAQDVVVEVAILEPQLVPTPCLFALLDWLGGAGAGSALGFPPRAPSPFRLALDRLKLEVGGCANHPEQPLRPAPLPTQPAEDDAAPTPASQVLPPMAVPAPGGMAVHVALHVRRPALVLVENLASRESSALALTLDVDVALLMLVGTGDLAANVEVAGLRAIRLDRRAVAKVPANEGGRPRLLSSRAASFVRYAAQTKRLQASSQAAQQQQQLAAAAAPDHAQPAAASGAAAHALASAPLPLAQAPPPPLRTLVAVGAFLPPRCVRWRWERCL